MINESNAIVMAKSHRPSRINILIAIDHISNNSQINGPGRVFFNLTTKLDKKYFNVIPCILRKEDSLKSSFEDHGIHIQYLGRGKYDPLVLLDLLKLIIHENIHVVHLHLYASSIFGRLVRIITRVPTILHAHGPTDYYGWKKRPYYSWYQQIADLFLAKFTDLVIAVSTEVRDVYVTQRRIDSKKVIVLPNAISLEEFTPSPLEHCEEIKRQFGIKPNHWVVGTVTRFIEVKGNRYLLEAAHKVLQTFPHTYFLIVGHGPLYKELKALSQRLQLEKNVIFTGFHKDVAHLLSTFDLKVVTSLSEGCPNALLEAMAMGRPIVAANVDGIKEILTDGETGLLVPPRDPQALAEKIIYLLQHDQFRKQLGSNAYRESRKYGIDTYIRDLGNIYKDMRRKGASQ